MNNNEPLITIAIPTYNTPIPFFNECINQILNQTYTNLDILIVDDGSEQAFVSHLFTVKQTDNRIRLIQNNVNKGIYITRNIICNNIKGEFLVFVDSDDYVNCEFVKTLYEAYLSSKIVNAFSFCWYKVISDAIDRNDILKQKETMIIGKDILLHKALRGSLGNNVVAKLIPSTFFKKMYIKADNGFDDAQLIPQLAMMSDVAVLSKPPMYYYRQRKRSITHLNNFPLIQSYKTFLFYRKIAEEHEKSCIPYLDLMSTFSEFKLCCINYSDYFTAKRVRSVAKRLKYFFKTCDELPSSSKIRKQLWLASMLPRLYKLLYCLHRRKHTK